jgi:hypothetical protein
VGKLYQTQFTFPENPGYATVYGAIVKFNYDRMAEDRVLNSELGMRNAERKKEDRG